MARRTTTPPARHAPPCAQGRRIVVAAGPTVAAKAMARWREFSMAPPLIRPRRMFVRGACSVAPPGRHSYAPVDREHRLDRSAPAEAHRSKRAAGFRAENRR
jgi:hypothetical protein